MTAAAFDAAPADDVAHAIATRPRSRDTTSYQSPPTDSSATAGVYPCGERLKRAGATGCEDSIARPQRRSDRALELEQAGPSSACATIGPTVVRKSSSSAWSGRS